ncbi:hypothetical protein PMI03_00476 [Rhizobium sp. AP16]|nr:hypothetical protein PMI03_00476 [Rhizobium sp. AP16]
MTGWFAMLFRYVGPFSFFEFNALLYRRHT